METLQSPQINTRKLAGVNTQTISTQLSASPLASFSSHFDLYTL
jgi:hypothetical protein